MNKTIDTLSSDVYTLLDAKIEHEPTPDLMSEYGLRIGEEMGKATVKRDKPREKGRLWASDLGKDCMRKHWYNFNMPEEQAPLMGHTKFKFLYGNLLEEAVLYLAEEAGHSVELQQDRVETEIKRPEGQPTWAVSGRIDGIVDGVLIDVKSTSSYGFTRYKQGITAANDSFGYLWQLGFYRAFGDYSAPEEGFIWIDKQNGHIAYTKVIVPTEKDIVQRANDIADAVETEEELDVRKGYTDEPYGKSGNRALCMTCSYCDFNKQCWPGLRTFAYGHKPIHMTEVTREPKVPEIVRC